MLPKIDELRIICSLYLPDIVCIVETWLDHTVDNSEIFIQGYCVHRLDRNRHGGGVLLFVKDVFTCSVLYKGDFELEFIVLSIKQSVTTSPEFCIALFYRPPSSDNTVLDNLFSTLCSIFITLPCKLILLGDFNIDFLSSCTSLYRKLVSIMSSFNLHQIVSEPTRISNLCSTLIDLIFVSSSVFVKQCNTIPSLANADHLGLHLDISSSSVPAKPKPVAKKIWRYNLGDFERAAELLESVEWSLMIPPGSVDSYWSHWKAYFLQIMELCIPCVHTKTNTNVPWMNNTIAKAIKKRDALFRTAKRTCRLSDLTRYKLQRNKTVSLLRNSKQLFFDKLSNSHQKMFWKAVRLLTNKRISIPSLECNGETIVSAAGKADSLNNFFYGCFNHNIPPLRSDSLPRSTPHLDPAACPEDILCTEESILDHLMTLDVTKSTGCDGISARMLKCTAVSIAASLTELFNLSISTGDVPSDWKIARIVPVPKGADQTLTSGYRPISILPVVSKIIEQHVKSLLETHLQNYAPISPHQWGFISSRSSISALLRVIDDLSHALDQGYEVCIVFFDISKAFDTVPHVPLLETLQNLNINEYLLRWIKSYLLQRSQYVAVERTRL